MARANSVIFGEGATPVADGFLETFPDSECDHLEISLFSGGYEESMNAAMARIAVLGSGTGSNFQALFEAFGDEIVLVISDQADSGILKKASSAGICGVFEKRGPDLCARILSHLEGIDLVCLAGFMRLVKEPLLSAFSQRILNIHPSLLPNYPGLEAWEQAIADGATESGCTVHFVDAGMDTGEVILQAQVPVLQNDTPADLHARIQVEEHRIYPEAVRGVLKEIVERK